MMCGRLGLFLPTFSITEFFKVIGFTELAPRYNVAPTMPVLAILKAPEQPDTRIAAPLHWGLIPSWAKDRSIAKNLSNARCETLAEKPSFRGAFKYRRCIVPASGFYEWQQQERGKQPMFISSVREEPLAIAGLWELWSGPVGEEIGSCTLITTEANALMAPIHDRMPVLLEPSQFDDWLDPSRQNPKEMQALLKPCPPEWLQALPVSRKVNSVRHQGPECLEGPEPESPNQQLSLF